MRSEKVIDYETDNVYGPMISIRKSNDNVHYTTYVGTTFISTTIPRRDAARILEAMRKEDTVFCNIR